MKSQAYISITNLHYKYRNHKNLGEAIFSGININIPTQGITSIIGRSGCGKTTLLKILGGWLNYEQGEITICIDSNELTHKEFLNKNYIGYLPQYTSLLPRKNIKDNLLFIYSIQKEHRHSQEEFWKHAMKILKQMRVDGSIHLLPGQLSGGMQQRILVVRALLSRPFPELILLDEPFSAVDPLTKQEIRNDTMKVFKQQKTTAIIVTHDMNQAIEMSDHIFIFPDKPVACIHYINMRTLSKIPSRDNLISLINIKAGKL